MRLVIEAQVPRRDLEVLAHLAARQNRRPADVGTDLVIGSIARLRQMYSDPEGRTIAELEQARHQAADRRRLVRGLIETTNNQMRACA
ncbi:MAG TPA: hypothetical protein VGG34_05125 [Opitutaceae bacterium]|jgi:hypothetical protein